MQNNNENKKSKIRVYLAVIGNIDHIKLEQPANDNDALQFDLPLNHENDNEPEG